MALALPADVVGTSFTIDQNGAGSSIVLSLNDRALPYRPIMFKHQQRAETDWYPGKTKATQQVSGWTVPPSEFKGKWKDVFIMQGGYTGYPPATISGVAAANVQTLVNAARQILKEGQQVEVTWGQEVYVGLLSEFEVEWDNLHDVAWTMHFDWAGEGAAELPPNVANTPSLSETSASIVQGANNVSSAVDVPSGYPVEMTIALAAIQAPVGPMIDVTQSLLNSLASWKLNTGDPVSDVPGFMPDTVFQLQSVSAQLELLLEQMDAIADEEANPSDSLLTYGLSVAYERDQLEAMRTMNYSLAATEVNLLEQIVPVVEQTYTALPGDDLRRVSQKFYGTAEQARTLAIFNRLSQFALVPGQQVLIPPAAALVGF